MSEYEFIRVRQKCVLAFDVDGYDTDEVEVRTRDIGATIGTELRLHGRRLIAYRPGTRHGSYAQDLAAEHLRAALIRRYQADEVSNGALARHLRAVVLDDGGWIWDPEAESDV